MWLSFSKIVFGKLIQGGQDPKIQIRPQSHLSGHVEFFQILHPTEIERKKRGRIQCGILLLPSLLSTISLCCSHGTPITFTRHRHKSPTADDTMLAEWWSSDLILDGTQESQLLPEIENQVRGDWVVEKSTSAREAFIRCCRLGARRVLDLKTQRG